MGRERKRGEIGARAAEASASQTARAAAPTRLTPPLVAPAAAEAAAAAARSRSRRKISSESFSSLGSDYLETSPEEEGECPLSRLCWDGSRSPPGPPEPGAAAATAGARRAQRRRRVNLDSRGESVGRLTAPR